MYQSQFKSAYVRMYADPVWLLLACLLLITSFISSVYSYLVLHIHTHTHNLVS